MNRRPEASCVWLAYATVLFVMVAWVSMAPPQTPAQILPPPPLPGSLIVTMTSPASGSTVTGTVPVRASVSIVGSLTVAGVQFKLDGANLGAEDSTTPYGISWNTTNTSNGSHTLTAVARDVLGVRYTSDPVSVTVFNDTSPPTVAITAPAAGDTVHGTIPVQATASDNVGVVGVQFYIDGALLRDDTSAPYSATWDTTAVAGGSHTLQARARDTAGNIGKSAVITVTVANGPPADTTPPLVSITSPSDGATVSDTVLVKAAATDASGVDVVQFLLDDTQVGALDTTAPYEIPWDTTAVADGSHRLQARARDAAGNIGESLVITVTVANGAPADDTTPPSVSITSPPAGATVSDSILVAADATDDVGVAGVRFLLDGAFLGDEDTSAPFSIHWDTTTTTDGTHRLAAVARDIDGNRTTSSQVSVTVSNDSSEPPPEPTVTRLEETDPAISLTGTWATRGEEFADFSGGTAASADGAGVTASLTFSGTAVSWLGWRCELCGIARVLLDGAETMVDTYAPTRDVASSVVFSASGLSSGSHTLTIEVTGTMNPGSSGAHIVVDAFDVTGDGSAPPPPTTTRIEENDPAIDYVGAWQHVCDARASGGCGEEAWEASQATLSFTGTAVRWIGWRNAGGGIARVYLDGTFMGEVDTYSPSTEPQAVVFTAGPLPRGAHTLTIEVTGTANPDSDSTVVIIDAFDLTS